MLRATTACTFSTSQLPKVVRTPQFLRHFTSKCASRHNGVQLFISHLPRCLRTRRFSEPTFHPSGATKPRKNTVFRDFPTFSRTCIFFLLIFSLLALLPAGCFFISPYCRKFDFRTSFDYFSIGTSKTPPPDPPLIWYGTVRWYGSLVRLVWSVRLVSVPSVPTQRTNRTDRTVPRVQNVPTLPYQAYQAYQA